jgi:hypothetical protein
MLKKLCIASVLFFGIFLCMSSANAALIGVDLLLPDILSNQTGIYTYTWDSDDMEGLFTARATPLTITTDGVTLSSITGDANYDVSFYLDGSGNFLRGVGGDDLVITGDVLGESGVLLTGEVTNFGWFDVPGSSIALFDFTFTVTGGELADFFELGLGGDITTAEKSDFAGDWMVNHEGNKVKHDTAAVVPIPAAAWLLGSGLFGLILIRRRKP